jgi:cytochrome c oxidase subunit II
VFRAAARTAGFCAGLLALMTLAGCSRSYPMDTLSNGSKYAREIHWLYVYVNWITAAIMLVVLIVAFLAIFVFSTREGEPGEPSSVSSDVRLEVAWTIIPALILVCIAVPTIRVVWSSQPAKWPKNALTVDVIAHQWWWEFRYPQYNIETADEAHFPVGREVHFELRSADVIHSFWIPAMGGKRDVIPGQVNELTFTPNQIGEFDGQCVEYCGAGHANMRFRAFAETKANFAKWVKEQQGPPATPAAGSAAAAGAKIFDDAPCAICHTIKGQSGFSNKYPAGAYSGPDLTHFDSRSTFAGSTFKNTPENVAMFIRNPDAMKPGAKMPALGIKGKDLKDLAAYLESLK